MSDEGPILDGEAEPGPEVVGDAGGDAVEQSEGGEQQQPRQYVEIDDPDNRYVRVRVDGEDVEVPYSEALKGYSREADYTRKTQSLAEQRQQVEYGLRLQQALEADPETTLRLLAQRHLQQQPTPAEVPEFDDPLERQLYDERQARLSLEQRINQREADEQLNQAIGGLRNQYGVSDEDVRAVVDVAYRNGFGVDAFPMIYKTMAFDRIQATVEAHRQQQATETARRQAAKTSAGQIVSSGTGSGNGLTNQVATGRSMSIREAVEAAFEQHEG